MKTEFQAKYLQHLVRKNKDKGFTLIELLVVIIIVGVLAAIALPSFLNQIGKARGSEAKASLGTINRSQQAYRLENGSFSNALTSLDAKISGKYYTYVVGSTDANNASATATAAAGQSTDVKYYSAAVFQQPGSGTTQEFFGQVICESSQNGTSAGAATAPTTAGTVGSCAAGTVVK